MTLQVWKPWTIKLKHMHNFNMKKLEAAHFLTHNVDMTYMQWHSIRTNTETFLHTQNIFYIRHCVWKYIRTPPLQIQY